jgi:hypothetical protein
MAKGGAGRRGAGNFQLDKKQTYDMNADTFLNGPEIGMCECGKTFKKVPANKKHCGHVCAKRAERKRKRVAIAMERTVPVVETVTEVQLRAVERMLVAFEKEDGRTFNGDGEVFRNYIPEDPRVLWVEAEKGVWNMVYVG